MDLIVNKMMEFQVVHESDCYPVVERLSGTSVTEFYLSVSAELNALPFSPVIPVFIELVIYIALKERLPFLGEFLPFGIYIVIGHLKRVHNVHLGGSVEYRR